MSLGSPSAALWLCSETVHLLAIAKWSRGEHLGQAGQSDPCPEVFLMRDRERKRLTLHQVISCEPLEKVVGRERMRTAHDERQR